MFSRGVYIFILLVILALKLSVLVYVLNNGHAFFGGSNDANYYHSYAIGETDQAANAWPIILRALNTLGLYSREITTFAMMTTGILIIPYLVGKLSASKTSSFASHSFWLALLITSFYPTLFYYSFDIYRDVFMVFVWLNGLFVYRLLSVTKNIFKWSFAIFFGVFIAFLLFELRPYLGLGYFLPLFLANFYSLRKFPISLSLFLYFCFLFAFYAFGLFEPILEYREIFSNEMQGGSNLGLQFTSLIYFVPVFLLNILYQLFGVFFINTYSIIVFLCESLPFLFFIFYVFKNRKFSNKFVDYLVIFFILYSTVWLLGNDNLGTAVRLRFFSYISIIIAFFVVWQNKKRMRDTV